MKRADQNHRGTSSSQKEALSSRAAVATPATVTPSTVTGSPGSDSGTTLVGDGGATPVDTGPAVGMGGPMLARTSSSPTPLGSGPGVVSAQKGGTQLTARGGGSEGRAAAGQGAGQLQEQQVDIVEQRAELAGAGLGGQTCGQNGGIRPPRRSGAGVGGVRGAVPQGERTNQRGWRHT